MTTSSGGGAASEPIATIDQTFGLRHTLRALSLGWGAFDGDGWWRPMRTPAGPATLRIGRAGSEILATAWGPGGGWAVDRAGAIIGLDDHPEDFEPDDDRVRRLAEKTPSRFGRTGLVFEALLWAVLGQKVTGSEAASAGRSITKAFSDPAPGPGPRRWLPPDPERIAESTYERFHPLGLERRRAEVLIRLAREASRLERLGDASIADAGRYLIHRPGVGRWTVAETLVVSHGDVDAVSVGDFHLKHQVVWHLTGRERGTDAEMLEALEPFRPHRARVIRLLEALPGYPRRGPRTPVRSFRTF